MGALNAVSGFDRVNRIEMHVQRLELLTLFNVDIAFVAHAHDFNLRSLQNTPRLALSRAAF